MPQVGSTLYAQGLCLNLGSGTVDLSHGLRVAADRGNAQPTLQYTGPSMTAVPFRFGYPALSPTWRVAPNPAVARYELLLTFAAPTPGYSVLVQNVVKADAVTKVYVALASSPLRLAPWFRDRSAPTYATTKMIDLGADVARQIEVWVDAQGWSLPRPFPFELAAVIGTNY